MSTAFVTGANRGIGLGITKYFVANGYVVFACARQERESFSAELDTMNREGPGKAIPLYFDLLDEKAVKEAVQFAEKNSEGIDVLINNAGINKTALFQMTRMADLRETFETNLFTPIFLSQLVTRYMARRRRGAIINIASVSGIVNSEGSLAYGCSKAAVIYATKSMAQELGPLGIRVNSISPGFINTDMWGKRSEASFQRVLDKTPLHRQGQTEEIAKTALFLAEDSASFITGCNVVVDGGGLASWL